MSGQAVYYKMTADAETADISLVELISKLQKNCIVFTEKPKNKHTDTALQTELLKVSGSVEGNRNTQLNTSAFVLGQIVSTGELEEDYVKSQLTRAARMTGLDEEEIEKTIEGGIAAGKGNPRLPLQLVMDNACMDEERLTSDGHANRFIRLNGQDVRYCHSHKKWMVWDKSHWRVDEDGKIYRFAQGVIIDLYTQASFARGEQAKSLARAAIITDNPNGIKSFLELASIDKRIAITADRLNSDPWILATGGVSRCQDDYSQ